MFAGILTRWSKGYRSNNAQIGWVAALYHGITPASTDMNPVSIPDVKREKVKYPLPKGATKNEEGTYRRNGEIWISEEPNNLKLRMAVEAHCRERGHKAYAVVMDIISKTYWWIEMKQEIGEFTQPCIHCIVLRNGKRIPHPSSTALHDEKPNDLIYEDFLYLGPVEERDLKYLLIIIDDISSCT